MKIADQNISTGMLRQNILEKANEAFSGNKTTEEFSKKINDAINSVADSQNKASKITKDCLNVPSTNSPKIKPIITGTTEKP